MAILKIMSYILNFLYTNFPTFVISPLLQDFSSQVRSKCYLFCSPLLLFFFLLWKLEFPCNEAKTIYMQRNWNNLCDIHMLITPQFQYSAMFSRPSNSILLEVLYCIGIMLLTLGNIGKWHLTQVGLLPDIMRAISKRYLDGIDSVQLLKWPQVWRF